MNKSTFLLKTKDNETIYVRKWMPVSNIQTCGVVQLAHGISEHSARYEDYAIALTQEGFIVYANDHRGHGRTATSPEHRGFVSENNGWSLLVEDLNELTLTIKKQHSGVPIFLFGHSMGSFLVRRYMQLYGNEINGVILSGTSGNPGNLGKLGVMLTRMIISMRGTKARSKLLAYLTFGLYNRSFKPNRTPSDWLSRDEREVDKYVEDDMCGEISTASFFYEMFTGLMQLYNPVEEGRVPSDLPIYLFSGDQDRVGKNGKDLIQIYNDYQRQGSIDVSYKLYPGGRHEMLNELNKHEVYQDTIDWLKLKI